MRPRYPSELVAGIVTPAGLTPHSRVLEVGPGTGRLTVPLAEIGCELRAAAEALAARTEWPALYDLDRLAANEVPVVAAVYHDDMYVEREQSLATADAVRGLRTWVTDAYAHDGVRADAAVLDRLIAMARDES